MVTSREAAARPALAAGRHRVLWIGSQADVALRIARLQAAAVAEVTDVASPLGAVVNPAEWCRDSSPAVILLATSTPSDWGLQDLVRLRNAWPLAPIVSVASTLIDGRRRSGPPLSGVEEVPWHDLAGRLAWWLAERSAGRPGTLGLPATVRREERFLEGPKPLCSGPRPRVAVAARRRVDLDAAGDLVVAAGGSVGLTVRGRPGLDTAADLILWDIATPDDADLAWLRMLVAQRPGRRIVVLESFPRAERVAAMLRAGALAVLGRPASAEALAGLLLQSAKPPGIGLG